MVLNKLSKLSSKKDRTKKIDGKNFTAIYASDKKGELEKMASEYRKSGYMARIKKGISNLGNYGEILFVRKE